MCVLVDNIRHDNGFRLYVALRNFLRKSLWRLCFRASFQARNVMPCRSMSNGCSQDRANEEGADERHNEEANIDHRKHHEEVTQRNRGRQRKVLRREYCLTGGVGAAKYAPSSPPHIYLCKRIPLIQKKDPSSGVATALVKSRKGVRELPYIIRGMQVSSLDEALILPRRRRGNLQMGDELLKWANAPKASMPSPSLRMLNSDLNFPLNMDGE